MGSYGIREKAAFNSLGKRPLEILEDKEGSIRLNEIVQELREDEQVETVMKPLVEKYFEVLEAEGVVEYDEPGTLFSPKNNSLHRNGYSEEYVDEIIQSFD